MQQRVELQAARALFVREAQSRLQDMESTGQALAWEDVRQYMRVKAAGKPAKRPRVRKLKA